MQQQQVDSKTKVYPKEVLFARGEQREFAQDAKEAAFLLGGIGTGNISLGARGELRDFEIFNRPGKGDQLYYSFFAIWAQAHGGGEPIAKVLEAELQPPFGLNGKGYHAGTMAGLPRLKASKLRGEYPLAQVEFEDESLPVSVKLEAFTPLIPLQADDSGIPAAVLRYKVSNPSSLPVDVSIVGSMSNPVGWQGLDRFDNTMVAEIGVNELREDGRITGVHFTSPKLPADHLRNGSMSLMTTADEVTMKPTWQIGSWWDGAHEFWDDFAEDGRLEQIPPIDNGQVAIAPQARLRVGSIGSYATLLPGEEKTFEFVLAWHFPNRPKHWDEDRKLEQGEIIRNHYATKFEDAWAAGRYLIEELDRLESGTRAFHQALFGSTLPSYVIDALSANMTVLRSTTCFRVEGGTFYAFEGSHSHHGSCHGTCTHVWNYAQTAAFLFPELERSARNVEFLIETDEHGNMAFRTQQTFGMERFNMPPAVDGQMGTIVRLYREWKLSGDHDFLHGLWEKAGLALDFAFGHWDSDGDGVLDSEQHNTYDIEFFGPNSLANSLFLAALKAGAEMAAFVGDTERAERYTAAFERGKKRVDELLWNGEYYVQRIDDVNAHLYQYGIGCLSDQVFGQFLAHVAGLGYILPEDHVKQAVASIFRYNFRTDFYGHANVQRTYTLGDEQGLLLCSWPHGGRPKVPFVYADEVWTGIEYHVAAHLIYEGMIEEGLTIVKAVRDRHDGYRRNPWAEEECGYHYARSLASWAVLLSLSGFTYDMREGTISFAPVIEQDDFSCFWSTGTAWGTYRQQRNADTGELTKSLDVLYGDAGSVRLKG
ncbi:uncharacterized protein (DUF608 family) [Paenibacillus taihuensis]|uniref:Uncharacterized protein (DUF608 family) n=1 Tax=Paenibacillus taihuensis TaxID=1156355 RepID=A0A3D9S7L0_9BACL|nr:GH116 family glycosyl-hydrolase [Paenibacillus taihuensis]REE86128.1 uncharacterized protein (DUF608 family) [Paenibacillus taihuensis]